MTSYKNWHSHALADVLKNLKTSKKGLSSNVAKNRLKRNGANSLPKERKNSKLKLFLQQFRSPLMYILFGTIAISFFLGHYSDSAFILIVVLINTFVGFWQENKANNSLEELRKMVKIRVRVLRDAREKEIDSEDLVQGDIVLLNPGDKVPADCRIIRSDDLKVNEAPMTGEWLAVSKQTGTLARETVLAERSNMLFMGTSVEKGTAEAVVAETGLNTEFGKIVSLVKQTEEPQTPLQKKIGHLSKIVGAFVVLLVGVISLEGYFLGRSFEEVFISALALAVSAIPEGLLPGITVVLVLAMRRILKKRGVVKKLSAAEGLGSVTVVCTDKTGTLTEGNMQVSHVLSSEKELLGQGILEQKIDLMHKNSGKTLALTIASLTNDAFIENPQDELHKWIIRGYFTDKALLLGGIRAGLDMQKLEKDNPLIKKLNFSSHLRFAASLRGGKQGERIFAVGAPEELLKRSSFVELDGKKIKLGASEIERIKRKINELTSKGLRVVSCAYKEISTGQGGEGADLAKISNELIFSGVIALKDPVRKDVGEAMEKIVTAGIRPIIITGDHKLTAKAVALELGLEIHPEDILEGVDIERMDNVQLKERVGKIKIVARALPEHKLKIVEALHRNGEIVAMFGDGVNDAPALKASDIGVAVGSGTGVAKEVADIILLDDNFSIIVKAIEQGRVAFNNIRKVFIYLVADDFTEIFLFIGALALGLPLPLLAAQILWINLVEDSFPNIALTTDQETEGVMEEKPRDPGEPILSSSMKRWMAVIFLLNGAVTFLFFVISLGVSMDVQRARTLVFVLMAFDSLAFAYSIKSLKHSVFSFKSFDNKYLNWAVLISFVLLVLAVYAPPLQNFLGTLAIGKVGWIAVVAVTVFEIVIIEAFKEKILLNKTSQAVTRQGCRY